MESKCLNIQMKDVGHYFSLVWFIWFIMLCKVVLTFLNVHSFKMQDFSFTQIPFMALKAMNGIV